MVEPFTVQSRSDHASLELRPHDRDYFIAALRIRGLEATARVSSYMSGGLGEFFAGLAAEWRGWKGVRAWSSLEGELQLRAKSDRSGHVFFTVQLRDGAPARWEAEVELIVEAGQLDRLAASAREFEAAVVTAA